MKASGTGGGARPEGSLKEGGSLVGGAPGGLTCLWDGCADPFCTIPGFSCGKFWVLPCNHSDSLAVFQERRLLPVQATEHLLFVTYYSENGCVVWVFSRGGGWRWSSSVSFFHPCLQPL